ncbi:MAG: hypothetical protein SPF19_14070 [Oliverpabstia sp.]|nr:hypothetical protein [bacterium]MDY2885213.1 hypothetical protein [Bariatricus sp.]MDY5027621.1 hypothetical protein [Oliverpabstia sp.]
MEKINLNENWCICCTDDAKCFYSDVPATVANTLYENGEIEDPYYGENEWKTYDVLKKDYEFTNTFSVSNKVISSDKVLLRFEGLDTAADIYLNDQHLAFVNDMNRTYEFDVKDILKEGENSIRILFHSNIEYALEQHRKEPYYTTSDTVDGFSLVRKAHCTYGWDWGPKLPDMGIWRPVSIVAYNLAKFEDVYVRQHHHEGNVEVQFDVAFERLANGKETELEISIVSPEGNCIEQKYCGIKTKDSYTIQKTDRIVRESELQLYPCVGRRIFLRRLFL